MVEYRLTPAAERDLEDIWRYTFETWGVDQAHRYIDVLTAAFAVSAAAPGMAPACDHIRAGYRRRGVERHIVYYRITAYGIEIVRVLHERMNTAGRF